MDRKDALRRVLFLKTLPEPGIALLAASGQERSLQKGELLLVENTPTIGLVVVLEGAIKVYKLDRRGRELTLGLERPGASVEELPLFDGGNYPASAEAAVENTRVLIISQERFQELMNTYPGLAVHVLRALAIRMRKQVQMIEAQSLHTVRARLASYLLRTANGRPTFMLDETNEAIASHIGSVRDVVSRTLSGLKEAGVIDVNGRRVTILNNAEMSLIATSEDSR
jgi:CRP-like cAMP-binding protein